MKAYVVLADGFEEIEAIAPIDLLRRAGVETLAAGVPGLEITGAHGIKMKCDIRLAEALPEDAECVVLPGGMKNAQTLAESKAAREFLAAVDARKGLVAAICASPAVVLAKSFKMLGGRAWTCYPGLEKGLPDGNHRDEAVVRDGNLLTSRGPGTALEFALALVRALRGDEKADALERELAV